MVALSWYAKHLNHSVMLPDNSQWQNLSCEKEYNVYQNTNKQTANSGKYTCRQHDSIVIQTHSVTRGKDSGPKTPCKKTDSNWIQTHSVTRGKGSGPKTPCNLNLSIPYS